MYSGPCVSDTICAFSGPVLFPWKSTMGKAKLLARRDLLSIMPKRKEPAQENTNANVDAAAEGQAEAAEVAPPNKSSRRSDEERGHENTIDFEIPLEGKSISCKRHGHAEPPALIFTHGAGGGITAPATRSFAEGFAGVSPIVCFQGSMNLANRIKYFHAAIDHQHAGPTTALGGRSLGARAAVLTALGMDEKPDALVLVSYPLMAGSKGERREPERREKILTDLPDDIDVLFVIGSRDAQCDLAQLRALRGSMKASSWLLEVCGANHGMRVGSARGVEAVRRRTGEIAAQWLKGRDPGRTYGLLEWNDDESTTHWGSWNTDRSSSSHTREGTKRRMD